MDPITVTCETRPGLPPALTVTQLARVIRETVRGNPILSRILVRGEVSNLQRAPAGHVFFSLKDATSQLACVLFRDDAAGLGFDLEDGMDVVVSRAVEDRSRTFGASTTRASLAPSRRAAFQSSARSATRRTSRSWTSSRTCGRRRRARPRNSSRRMRSRWLQG